LGHRNVHGIIYFYVRACVCTLGTWVRAHVCVRTFLDVLAPKLVKTSLSVGYMRTCVCILCAHNARVCTARICALTHFRTDYLHTWCNILRVTEGYIG
jgi:hypothetical protein